MAHWEPMGKIDTDLTDYCGEYAHEYDLTAAAGSYAAAVQDVLEQVEAPAFPVRVTGDGSVEAYVQDDSEDDPDLTPAPAEVAELFFDALRDEAGTLKTWERDHSDLVDFESVLAPHQRA